MEKNYQLTKNVRQCAGYNHLVEDTSAIRSAPVLCKTHAPAGANARPCNPNFLSVYTPGNCERENSTGHQNYVPDFPDSATRTDEEFRHEPLTKKNGSSSTILPPDGGWGWIVCFSSLLIVLIIDGVLFSFGVFFLDLLEDFKESRAKTAWVGSTVMGVHMAAGPAVSVMVNKYGCRKATIIGALISTFGIGVSIVSPNVDVLILTYGFIGGFGFSMMFIPAILMVNFYFDKHRALANGIAMCGSGLGMFVFANLCNALSNAYDWRGSTLIIAGIVLNCAVCGALYRPIEENYSSPHGSKESLDCKKPKKTYLQRLCNCCTPRSRRYTEEQVATPINEVNNHLDDNEDEMRERSLSMSTHKSNDVSVNVRSLEKPLLDPRVVSIRVTDFSPKQHNSLAKGINTPKWMLENTGANITQSFTDIRSLHRRNRKNAQQIQTSHKLAMSPLYRKDIFYSGNLLKLPEFQSRGNLRSYTKSVTIRPDLSENEEQLATEDIDKSLPKRIANMCRSIDLSLFTDPLYLIFTASCVFWTAQSTVMNYIPEYVVLQGLSKENAAMLVSTVGITNVLGRLTSGWLSDRPHMDCKIINGVALFCGGLCMSIVPFTSNYVALIALCAVFGFCMGTWVSLRPICLVDLFGIEKLTNSLGILVMFQGAAFTVGPPIAGWLFDLTNSHLTTFLSCGAIFICSGLLCVSLRWLKIRRMRNKITNNQRKIVVSNQDDLQNGFNKIGHP